MPDAETRARRESYDWPGNVRQLENAIARMVVLAPDEWLTPDLLPIEVTGGNRTRAAALLGVQRTHLSLLLRQYGPAAPDPEAAEPEA